MEISHHIELGIIPEEPDDYINTIWVAIPQVRDLPQATRYSASIPTALKRGCRIRGEKNSITTVVSKVYSHFQEFSGPSICQELSSL